MTAHDLSSGATSELQRMQMNSFCQQIFKVCFFTAVI